MSGCRGLDTDHAGECSKFSIAEWLHGQTPFLTLRMVWSAGGAARALLLPGRRAARFWQPTHHRLVRFPMRHGQVRAGPYSHSQRGGPANCCQGFPGVLTR
jgi:hypothetical protein